MGGLQDTSIERMQAEAQREKQCFKKSFNDLLGSIQWSNLHAEKEYREWGRKTNVKKHSLEISKAEQK